MKDEAFPAVISVANFIISSLGSSEGRQGNSLLNYLMTETNEGIN